MKKNILLVLMLFLATNTFAHYLWIETKPVGKEHKKHEIKVRFGEYTYGVIEQVNGDAFQGVNDFQLWLIAPDGSKTTLTVNPEKDHYTTSFVPTQKGTYTIALDNKSMKVLDYTAYDFGIFKPQYHAKARVVVGNGIDKTKETNPEGIEIIDLSDDKPGKDQQVTLKVLFKGKPLAKNEIVIYVADLWSKTLETDENGQVSLKLPWQTMYTVEVTYNEQVPGSFNNTAYEFIWHCATYCIPL
ncbi:Uncharacterized conserved protein, contains GH25 family domain [Zhouia amylolytica]|uniref:Uncharacterized conserved protein, contains GH25 family domain n=1 Tax=Zhouia amylolytica TaxID=376730 RepID=A0A1I6VLS2_9FLAO|nr:DUF4198 domain-containing protein [Zhouia amylolytica]MCQ0112263.1 DUF4198 domain-containing protein [Zhouia amylolytica]SFT14374.1 Uncharacterized conserved protein, contains GH25 family domain [Zhouia amylolytica]